MGHFFRITQLRSTIGLHYKTQRVLDALGLHKRGAVVYQRVTPGVAGMILRVKELVHVEKADRYLTRKEIRNERKSDPGYYVESSANSQSDTATTKT